MIAFDAKATGAVTPGTNFTMGHTCSGSNRILFIGIAEAGVTATNMTVTYNSVPMTMVTGSPKVNGGACQGWLFYLINPASGANTISVSWTGSTYIRAISASYNGTQQSSQPNAHNENTATGTSITTTAVSTLNNCWHVSFVLNDGTLAFTNSTGVVSVRENGSGLSNVCSWGDSNGPITTGSYSMTWTCGSQNIVSLQASIASDVILSSMMPDLI